MAEAGNNSSRVLAFGSFPAAGITSSGRVARPERTQVDGPALVPSRDHSELPATRERLHRSLRAVDEATLSREILRALRGTSRHEAAHVVLAHLLGVPVLKVEMLTSDCRRLSAGGLATTLPLKWRNRGLRSRVRHELLILAAGPVWESAFGEGAATGLRGGSNDLELIRSNRHRRDPVGKILREALAILRRPLAVAMVFAVSEALYGGRGFLWGAEVGVICRRVRRQHRRAFRRAALKRVRGGGVMRDGQRSQARHANAGERVPRVGAVLPRAPLICETGQAVTHG